MFLHLHQFFDQEDRFDFLQRIYDFYSWLDIGQGYHLHLDEKESIVWKNFFSKILKKDNKEQKLISIVNSYCKSIEIDAINPSSIFKYPVGEQLFLHKDAVIQNEVSLDSFVSFIFYLNDNYDGGEFYMVNQRDEEVVIKPKSGDIIIIDNTVLHGSKTVKNNYKFIAVSHSKNIKQ